MTFLWPTLLVLIAALPVLVLVRVWALRRRRTGVRFSSLSLVRVAAPGSSWLRRHLPFALFVLGLGSLVLAMARPAAIVAVPSSRTTVVLAMDVSRSMCATDIPPNRLVVRTEPFELTPLLAGLGFALLLVGGVASLRWFGRMP